MRCIFILLTLWLTFSSCQSDTKEIADSNASSSSVTMHTQIDWQGHRGARGLLAENTIPAFLLALEYPAIKTLELDVVITQDQEVIVSHEPWMSADICNHPDGTAVNLEEAEALNIYAMPLSQVQAFDCGSRGNSRFPRQAKQAAYKPTLAAVIKAADARASKLKRPLPFYNIELKSRPEWDNKYTPPPAVFAELVAEVIKTSGATERVTIQSFDPRSLRAMRTINSEFTLALLIENVHSVQRNLDELGFKPDIYSPYFVLCSKHMLDTLHEQNIQLIPWTVNDIKDMQQLIDLGVDGIITDYPDLISQL